jgi:threonine 3-dehydrogenase
VKALVKAEKREGFTYQDLPDPVVGPGDVLVKVDSATICGSDVMFYHWHPAIRWMVTDPPFVPGHEGSGTVLEVGDNVKNIEPGDRVAFETHLPCGECFQCRTGEQHICRNMTFFGHQFDGCFAELTAAPQRIVFKINHRLPLDRATLLEPLGVAQQCVQKAEVAGDTAVVIGAGPIGLMALYLAKRSGAGFVAVTDINDYRLAMAKDLGADLVLPAGDAGITERILEVTDGVGVGSIIDASGSAPAISESFFYLRKGGRMVLAGNPKEDLVIRQPVKSLIHKEITLKGVHGRRMFETWEKTQQYLLDPCFPLDRIVTHQFKMEQFEDAFRLIDTGECGKIRLKP